MSTLFDHYCARLHVGLGLEVADARALRSLIDQAIDVTPGGISHQVIRRALLRTARATASAPLKLADNATGGEEITAATEVDEEVERQLADREGPLARAALAVELELSAEENPFMDRLVDNFEDLWRSRKETAT